MPLYEYECDNCGQRFEVIQKFSDAPITECRKCGGGPVQKLLSSPAIQFKGSGFYLTDYGRGTSSKAESAGNKSGKTDKGEKSEKGGEKAATGAGSSGDGGTKSESASSSGESKSSTGDTSSAKSTPAKSD